MYNRESLRWCIQDNEGNHEEPAAKRVAKRADKEAKPSRKKKVRGGGAFPVVRVSNSARTKIIVLNVVGLLCDIRPLHDRREWGTDLVVHYESDLNVKIKKRTDCGQFLTMLCSSFDVGIWSPIEHSLLGVVAKFLASGTQVRWSFLWGKEISGSTRDLHDLFSMIPYESAGAARCLQFDCDATATAMSPPSNVLNCTRWDPLEPNDDFLSRIIEPFQALARNPSDMEYCVGFLGKKVGLAAKPRKLVGPWPLHFCYHEQVHFFFPAVLPNSDPSQPCMQEPKAVPKVVDATPTALAIGSKVTIMDLDDEMKATANVVAHGVIVSLAGGMLHGRIIEEGNASITISSIVEGSEAVFLYEGNNSDDPPMVRLGDALNSVTKWPLEALKAT